MNRRTALMLTGAGLAGGLTVRSAEAAQNVTVFFDPDLPAGKAMAKRAGARTVAIDGDRVRLWRAARAGAQGPVQGITSWSDYLLLRELAGEDGLRIRSETHQKNPGAPMTVLWTAA